MERKRTTSAKPPESQTASPTAADPIADVMSIAQIQRLVRLLDRSDISEIEVKRASEGVHLVLRKVKAQDSVILVDELVSVSSVEGGVVTDDVGNAKRHNIVAPLVGVFHPWLKQRGGTLIAVGDHVKAGQLLGTIESLNVLNEVESTVAGRVVEIHVQDGQPVEYGQALVTIEMVDVEDV